MLTYLKDTTKGVQISCHWQVHAQHVQCTKIFSQGWALQQELHDCSATPGTKIKESNLLPSMEPHCWLGSINDPWQSKATVATCTQRPRALQL